MIPHERSLVQALQDKPFALIGVNSDRDLDQVHGEARRNGVTWRSFWCGPKGAAGPIPSKWGVSSWPTIYVLDHKGVIRFKNVRGDEMSRAVEQLLAESEQEQAAGRRGGVGR